MEGLPSTPSYLQLLPLSPALSRKPVSVVAVDGVGTIKPEVQKESPPLLELELGHGRQYVEIARHWEGRGESKGSDGR